MLHKTKGIVLHTIKFTDSSIITKIYTEDFGLQSYIVNGVRTANGKTKASLFSPLQILDLEIYRRENKNLQRLKEFRPAFIYKSIPFDVLKCSITLFLAEALYKSIREEETNHTLYSFIEASLLQLDEAPYADSNFHLCFLLQLAQHIGFSPSSGSGEYFDLKEGAFTDDIPAHQYFIGLPHSDFLLKLLTEENHIAMSLAERNTLLENILLYYSLHLQDFRKLSSHHVLHDVLEGLSVA